MRVLIAEDDENSRLMLHAVLENSGYSVTTCANGLEALDQLKQSKYDLIISDILMPDMDGFELCRHVKADSALASIPFVFYTATYTDAEDERFALSLGASRFIVKPVEPNIFIDLIKEVLQSRKESDLIEKKGLTLPSEEINATHTRLLSRKLDKRNKELQEEREALQITEGAYHGLFENSPVATFEQDYSSVVSYLGSLRSKNIQDFSNYIEQNANVVQECAALVTTIDLNQAALTLIGVANKGAVQENNRLFFETIIPRALPAILLCIWNNKEKCKLDTKLNTFTHDQRDVEMQWAVCPGFANAYSRVFVGIIDITDRIKAAEKIASLNEELERRVARRTRDLEVALKELNSFSYSVSHDLQAPLRAINGFSTSLLEEYHEELDQNARHYIERIHLASIRMDEIIKDLLTLSKVSMEEFKPEMVDMSIIAESILTNLKEQNPDILIKTEVQPNMKVKADRRLLTIMLENLLGNALKFTSKKCDPEIKVGMKKQYGQPIYFISDNGAGFDMRYKDKLFTAFKRLHNQSDFPGTGIGLATVAKILERHGNKIWAEATPNEGASFYFTLD